ncbi:Hypothetical protein PEIBARAKI_5316 [Petrimonas sp. IBARAKI]|jgi:hypothetical protein|nr:Hypothetical protein PEIBARAKI_5316 [Petrimonas sp. IBARAKI]
MKQKESPTRLEPMQSIISFDEVQGKDMNIIYDSLSNRQKKVFDLLCTRKQSVTDITIALGYGDPRSYIRDIREKGIVVNDQWIEKPDIRYKVYWIKSNKRSCETLSLGEILDSPAFNNTKYGRR